MRHLLLEIGSFAGLAAFFGLGVLALLSFSQGRDIRRLREWAGSAPERESDRKDATSEAAAGRAAELRALEESREAEREAAELRERRRQRREAGLPELTRAERLRSHLGQPLVLVAVVLIALLVVGGVGYVVFSGGGSGSSQGKGHSKPAEIEVTVLNGTATPGLAARYGDKVKHKGFSLGAVTNSRSSFTESVVMFSRGHEPEAKRVAKALGISKVKLETSDVASVAAGAPVSVIVGEDNAAASP